MTTSFAYSLLGRSGLRVSPLCLGTMTFGTDWGWGAPRDTVYALLDHYLDAGGNFLDTADGYTNGTSEMLIGDYLADRQRRDQVVLATKFTFSARDGDPNAGGNGRKNICRALDGSLRRLRTDYVDLYWLHAWDGVTPVEEVMATLDGLVRAGKVRYIGLSNVPAWYLARAQTLAELRGWERVVALQAEYSLVERNIEREHLPAARELALAICPWSPLAHGLLSGKYRRDSHGKATGDGRLDPLQRSGHPVIKHLFSERNWQIVDAVVGVARELGRSPADVALAWVARRPQVASTLIGATGIAQLRANLAAFELAIPLPLAERLDEVSRPTIQHPYNFFEPDFRALMTGGTQVVRASGDAAP